MNQSCVMSISNPCLLHNATAGRCKWSPKYSRSAYFNELQGHIVFMLDLPHRFAQLSRGETDVVADDKHQHQHRHQHRHQHTTERLRDDDSSNGQGTSSLDMPTVGKRNAAELGRAGSMWSSLTVAWSGLVPLSTTLHEFERLTCIILQLSCVQNFLITYHNSFCLISSALTMASSIALFNSGPLFRIATQYTVPRLKLLNAL